jgi:hypothetical protein
MLKFVYVEHERVWDVRVRRVEKSQLHVAIAPCGGLESLNLMGGSSAMKFPWHYFLG